MNGALARLYIGKVSDHEKKNLEAFVLSFADAVNPPHRDRDTFG